MALRALTQLLFQPDLLIHCRMPKRSDSDYGMDQVPVHGWGETSGQRVGDDTMQLPVPYHASMNVGRKRLGEGSATYCAMCQFMATSLNSPPAPSFRQLFPELLRASPYVTENPAEADYFYADAWIQWPHDTDNVHEIVAAIREHGPWFDRKNGSDHIFVMTGAFP